MRRFKLIFTVMILGVVILILVSFDNLLAKIKSVKVAKGEKKMKVAMIIAKTNFRDEEYLEPKKILTSAGIEVITVSSSLGEAIGMLGAKVKVDTTIDRIEVENYDGIIFVGGTGAQEYWDSQVAHKIILDAVQKDKVVGAICIAPVILARSGVLKNKKATVFPSEISELQKYGSIVSSNKVEVDGKIITASGPSAAKEFGEKIKELLLKK